MVWLAARRLPFPKLSAPDAIGVSHLFSESYDLALGKDAEKCMKIFRKIPAISQWALRDWVSSIRGMATVNSWWT
jgi:hypothetical protein